MQHRATITLLAGIALVQPVCVLAQAPAQTMLAVRIEEQRRFTKVGLIMTAAVTRAAVERSDAQLIAAYRMLDAERQRVANAERDLKQARTSLASERKRSTGAAARADKAEAELARMEEISARQEAFLAELARRDPGYSAAQKVFADHMANIVQRDDPRIADALERYLAGDARALDDLSDYTTAIVAANRAADKAAKDAIAAAIDRQARKRDGDLLRPVAALWTDGADKGEKTSAQALEKWLEAAQADPDQFEQWYQVYALAHYLDRESEAAMAAEQLWARARSLEERVIAANTCATVHLSPGKWCNKAWTREQYMEEILRLRREIARAETNAPYPRLMLASVIAEQSEYKTGEDEPGRMAMLREAYDILDALHRAHPDNIAVEIKHFDVGSRLGIGLSSPDGIKRARQLREREVEYARSYQSRFPASWVANNRLAHALMDLSGITDMLRDEQASVTATDEAVAIAQRLALHDPGDMKRTSLVWSAHTRAGMSARVFAAFERERDHQRAALEAGRGHEDGNWSFMVELARPRLQLAELALGNLDAVRSLHDQVIADRFAKAAKGEDKEAYLIPFQRDLLAANYAWIEQDYRTAERLCRALKAGLTKAEAYAGLSGNERLIAATSVHIALSTLLIEQGQYPAAIKETNGFLGWLSRYDANPDYGAAARLLAAAVRLHATDVPGSPYRWKDIARLSFDGLDPKNFQGDNAFANGLIERRQALESKSPVTQTGKPGHLESLKRTFEVSDQLAAEFPPSASLFAGILSAEKMRAHAGDPRVPWQMVADDFVHIHKSGWLTHSSAIEDMHFALARAAILKRKAQASASGQAAR